MWYILPALGGKRLEREDEECLRDVLGESKGKRIVRRVLSTDPLTVEVSFEESGTMLGVAINGTGTYTSEGRPDDSLYGEGQGVMITADGEPIL